MASQKPQYLPTINGAGGGGGEVSEVGDDVVDGIGAATFAFGAIGPINQP
jgi:hypothetical protein